jgi:hypothetical protein
MKHSPVKRGYAMVIVLLLIVVITGTLGLMFYYLEATVKISRDLRHQLQAFYSCDGLDRVVLVLIDDYMEDATAPSAEDLETYLCEVGGGCGGSNSLPNLVPDGYLLESFSVTALASGNLAPIPAGPFRAMEASQTRLQILMQVVFQEAGENTTCRVDREVSFAQVLGTQFFLRGQGYVDWFPEGDLDIEARSHVNGDFCFASLDTLRLSRVTSSGALLHPTHEDCLTESGPAGGTAQIATNPDFDTFETWSEGTDNGCISCGGSDNDWQLYAQLTWRGRALDADHRVAPMRPNISELPDVQFGANALEEAIDNSDTLRFVVEPLTHVDDEGLSGASLARKAHIRILNGVWYLQDPQDTGGWPGVPIWSDHPGSMTTLDEEGVEIAGSVVGQDDLRDLLAWEDTPRRFSFYGIREDTGLLRNQTIDRTRVVSYGALARTAPDTWKPGHWVTAGGTAMCQAGNANATEFASVSEYLGCTDEAPASARVLNATRTGFHDPHLEFQSSGVGLAEILPINIDVAALLNALASEDTGELGTYFCDAGDGCFMDQPFNGLLWVSATWPGSMDGIGTGPPLSPPIQGSQGPLGTAQPAPPDHDSNQQALPFPLCSRDDAVIGEDLTSGTFFLVPDCSDYGYGDESASGAARPNAVRLFHIDDLLADSGGLEILDRDGDGHADGLTIASNLPMYLLGNTNETSVTTSASETSWTPLLVAADQLALQSRSWTDGNSGWGTEAADTIGVRIASETTWSMSVLAGWAPTAEDELSAFSGGVQGFLRTVEDWSNINALFTGSLDIAFSSVHYRWAPADNDNAAVPPEWSMVFDPHLAFQSNAPPGAPVYVVHAPTRWTGR